MTRPARGPAATPIPIPQVQGSGALSPYAGKSVTTSGVITAINDSTSAPGFFLQDPKGDGNVATSDALYVSTKGLDPVTRAKFAVGKVAQVSGKVSEEKNFTTVEATEKGVKLLTPRSAGGSAAIPDPVRLELPETAAAKQGYLEAREGMLATIDNALVIGPTTKYGNFTVVDEKVTGPGRHFGDRNAGRRLSVSGRIGPGTQMVTGDRVSGITGPIAYQYDDYELLQTKYYSEVKRGPYPPRMWGDLDNDDRITDFDVEAIRKQVGKPAHGPLDPADLNGDGKISAVDVRQAAARGKQETGAPGFTVVTLNAENFFDTTDAPPPVDDDVPSVNQHNNKIARLAGAIRDQLRFPEVVAMQEVENPEVLKELVERPELKAMGYKFAIMQTNGHRSINPAILYRGDTVAVTDVRQAQKMLSERAARKIGLVDDAGDKKPLFSREPLVVDMTITKGDQKRDVTMIANHLISKFSPLGLPTEPIRIEQAKFLNGLVRELKAAKPEREVVVLGDLNDTPESKSLKALTGTAKAPVLVNVSAEQVPQGERFSYNYKGKSELIDHILATPGLAAQVERAGVRHYNSDVSDNVRWGSGIFGASDHDNPYVTFRLGDQPAVDQAASGAATASRAARRARKS